MTDYGYEKHKKARGDKAESFTTYNLIRTNILQQFIEQHYHGLFTDLDARNLDQYIKELNK